MPWEVSPVSDIRCAFIHQVVTLHGLVAVAWRDFGVSRQTGYQWLRRSLLRRWRLGHAGRQQRFD